MLLCRKISKLSFEFNDLSNMAAHWLAVFCGMVSQQYKASWDFRCPFFRDCVVLILTFEIFLLVLCDQYVLHELIILHMPLQLDFNNMYDIMIWPDHPNNILAQCFSSRFVSWAHEMWHVQCVPGRICVRNKWQTPSWDAKATCDF